MARKKKNNTNGANLGFEDKLWQMADKLRDNRATTEARRILLGVDFLNR